MEMNNTLRNIVYMARRFKTATAFNLVGLVVSMAVCYLLVTQVLYQTGYNHGIDDYGRLYRMESNYVYNEWLYSENIARPMAEALVGLSEVESVSLATNVQASDEEYSMVTFARAGGERVRYLMAHGNNTAVSSLTTRRLSGSIEWTDDDQEGIIIPRSIAQAYFGTAQAAGREMTCVYRDPEGGDDAPEEVFGLKVRGVYEDFPQQSELTNCIYASLGDMDATSFNTNYKCIVKFKKGTPAPKWLSDTIKQRTIAAMVAASARDDGPDEADMPAIVQTLARTTFKFTPLGESYFEHSTFSSADSGYRGMLYTMRLACVLLIVIAAINFLNFTLAESPTRVRSLNTRRVLGATRRSLRLGIVAECVLTALAACVTALVLCELLAHMPATARIIEGDPAPSRHWLAAMAMLAAAAAVGVVAGAYPAIHATAMAPAMVLKSHYGLTPQGHRLRRTLMCVQLAIATLMVIYMGILLQQSYYIFNSDYGYDKDRVLLARLPLSMTGGELDELYQGLMHTPGVETAALSSELLGLTDGHNVIWTEVDGKMVRYSFVNVTSDYLRTMGISVVEGRDFNEHDTAAIIVNEAARHQWPWAVPGHRISTGIDQERGDTAVIVGTCKNVRYGSTRIGNDQPFFFILSSDAPCHCLNVRLEPGAQRAVVKQCVDALISRWTGDDKQAQQFNDELEQVYENELRYFNQMIAIGIVCLVVTLIGVFCMTLFETEYRRKEIGIRKVAGATTGQIVGLLCRQYVPLLLIGACIGAPLAYALGRLTLQHFAQSSAIGWLLLPAGVLLVAGVTLATVLLQSWRTARENPADSIVNS